MGVFDDETKRRLAAQAAAGLGLPSGGADYLRSPFDQALGTGPGGTRFPQIEKIHVPDTRDRPAILANVNALSEAQYEFDDKGFLRRAQSGAPEDGRARSGLYSEAIDAAIASDKTGTIDIDPNFDRPVPEGSARRLPETPFDQGHGGGVTRPGGSPGNTFTQLSGRGARLRLPGGGALVMTPEEVQLHEMMAHISPTLRSLREPEGLRAPPPGVTWDELLSGTPIAYENRARAQLGLPTRPDDDPHHGFLGYRGPKARRER